MNTSQLAAELHAVNRQESPVRVATPFDDHVMPHDATPIPYATLAAFNRAIATDADK